MDSKKVGYCSLNDEFTKRFAAANGLNYLVFSDAVLGLITKNIASVKNPKGPVDIFLAAIPHLRDIQHDTLILDIAVLMHDEAVDELKKDYKLIYLKNVSPKTALEQTMLDDYTERLEFVCDDAWD